MGKIPKRIDDRFLGRSIKNPLRKAYEDQRLGKFGPASPVRRIDPQTGKIIPKTEEPPPWD
jgi:hypothetical protein